mgnify:CR=1 FL=1
MADGPVRVILLEDQDDDALLIERELKRGGIAFTARRAVDRPSFIAALQELQMDLILSDNRLLGGFTGSQALELAVEASPATPFVFVSGTIGEEAAIETMCQGATDYVIKDHLARLIPVVKRALRESAGSRERARLEREILQAQKMESLGRMAGAVAHDFNNLLAIIMGNAELLESSAADAARTALRGGVILQAAERGRELTSRLLAFSRGQTAESSEFDLNARVAAFGPMFVSLLGPGIELKTEWHRGPLPLRGSPGQIDQVIMNLLVNAKDAIGGPGEVVIRTARLESPDMPPTGFPLLPPGSYAMLTLRDSGSGMTAEVKARLFEPFFTTKEPGRGTGLGLATVYGIVKQYGGGIAVESALGQGTEFRIVLPLATVDREGGVATARGNGSTVLVVDDEECVREFVRHVLEAAGCHRVVTAAGGLEAVALLERAPATIGLVLTDVMMPGVKGVQVARRARELWPGIPVLFMSGSETAATEAVLEIPGSTRLAKPVSPSDLLRAVRLAFAA